MKTLTTASRYWLLIFCFSVAQAWAQPVPTTNPLKANGGNEPAWTNQLTWSNVLLADKVKGLLSPGNQVDSLTFHQTIRQLSERGGGVLYFPAGTYQFTSSISLYNGVVLRGEADASAVNAKDKEFVPVTNFEFPRYRRALSRTRPDTLLFTDEPNTTAFKTIRMAPGQSHDIALVQLDINRAVIDFRADKAAGESGYKNILLLNLRENNAVLPDPGVPTAYQQSRKHDWQRWPWKEVASIQIDATANCLVSNCRVNDKPDDNYRQFGYMTEDGHTFDGARAVFDYSDHPGIYIRAIGAGESGEPTVAMANNFVAVSKGNRPIRVEGQVGQLNNEVTTTNPLFESSILDGRNATWTQYKPIYDKSDSITTHKVYHFAKTGALPYRIMMPLNYDPTKKYPLVVYLHGMGERGTDNHEQLRNFIWYFTTDKVRQEYPCIVLIPQHDKDEQSFLGSVEARNSRMMVAVLDVMKGLEKTYNIDSDRRYLIGISSGAWATWEAIVQYPNVFAAAVPISGYKRFNEFNERKRKREIENIKDLPIWAFHGSDDEWIPAMYARMTVSTLKNGGGKPRYTEFKGVGHICWNELQYVSDFMPWLFAQRRNQPPLQPTLTSYNTKP